MGLSAQSTIIQNVDVWVSQCEIVWCRSLAAGPAKNPAQPSPQGYAPGHGPGVATSGSCSTFVSKSLKPRRR